FKAALGDLAVAKLSPITAEMQRLMADVSAIDAVLAKGAERARAIAQPILDEVKDTVGFLRA
ncbi:MAG: tryptophan--tRNA ligase, partial [Rhodospirillales bacterium]